MRAADASVGDGSADRLRYARPTRLSSRSTTPGPYLLELIASIPLDLYEVRDWYEAFCELE
ncbi:hypothetical protein [Kitasatospora sp. NPDC051164]|uniref:hypothetical protein n=1 Tax=Kitasatospora sp. NPDC051164 TaxID=3364055 RepID=UPI0037B9F932